MSLGFVDFGIFLFFSCFFCFFGFSMRILIVGTISISVFVKRVGGLFRFCGSSCFLLRFRLSLSVAVCLVVVSVGFFVGCIRFFSVGGCRVKIYVGLLWLI